MPGDFAWKGTVLLLLAFVLAHGLRRTRAAYRHLIWALTLFRSYLLYAAVGPFVLSFIVGRSKDIMRNLFLGSALALALVYFGGQAGGTAEKIQSFDLVELQKLRSWSSSAVAAATSSASRCIRSRLSSSRARGLACLSSSSCFS